MNNIRYTIIADRDSRYDGQFYFAVRTTGIVCRPSCPANRPLEKNVVFFDVLDEATREGYRTCKRCRPEKLLSNASNISSALLQGQPVHEIAEMFHVTDRHVRRVAQQSIGASPKDIEQARRILTAKNLLAHTTLSVTDVAYSSDFGSLRQFNDHFKQVVSLSPSDYRKQYAKEAHVFAETNVVTVKLAYSQPLAWTELKSALLAHMIPGLEKVDDDQETLSRLILVGGRVVPVSISLAEPNGYIEVEIGVTDTRDVDAVVATVKRVFDLDARPDRVQSALGSDTRIGPLIQKHPGLRVCGMFDPFELLINTIIGQQVSIPAARTFSERLVRNYGKKFGELYTYPTAKMLAAANPMQLYETTKINHKKVATIQAVCRLIAEGFDLSAIVHDAAAREQLLAIKGIGPWTVEYVLLRGFGDPDGFPADDLFIKRLLGVKTAKATEKIAEKWRPYRGYATMQLWTKGTYE